MAIQDTLKHKWDGITPRERALVVLLGVSVPVIVLLWMALGIGDRLDEMERENAKMRRALAVLAETRAHGGPAQAAAGPVIPPEPVKLESYLDKAAAKVGISVPVYKPHAPQPKGTGYTMHTVDFSVAGLTMDQVKDFCEAIETDNRLVVITALNLKRSFSDKTKLDLKVEVSTFSQAAAAPAAGAGSASGATPEAPAGGTP